MTELDLESWAIAEREWRHPASAFVQFSQPAAGEGLTYEPQGAVVTALDVVTAQLVTSSATASRIPTLTINGPGGVTAGVFPCGFTVAASKTVRVTWGVGLVSTGANDGPTITVPIPQYVLEVGTQVVLSVTAEDVGDQVGLAVATVRQWPVRGPIGN